MRVGHHSLIALAAGNIPSRVVYAAGGGNLGLQLREPGTPQEKLL